MGAPTATVAPSGTINRVTRPADGAGMSLVALSVSTWHSVWSRATTSPALTFQCTSVPSTTLSPSAGITTAIAAMRLS
ncbi:MAG TPA: hypothetical protein VG389_17290 [Myxococcota bacterium]|nr:hypothetical protein [Myxococcota bacterium]